MQLPVVWTPRLHDESGGPNLHHWHSTGFVLATFYVTITPPFMDTRRRLLSSALVVDFFKTLEPRTATVTRRNWPQSNHDQKVAMPHGITLKLFPRIEKFG